jgi:hypothetical protein
LKLLDKKEPCLVKRAHLLRPWDATLWRRIAVALMASWCLALPSAAVEISGSGSTSVEELERKIEAAENRKKRGNAERPTAQPAAAPADSGRLLVKVDAPCNLRVGGPSVRSFKAPGSAVITLEAGEQFIECVSYANPDGAKAREVIEVSSGKQTVVSLSFAQAEARARAAEEAASRRFKAVSGDIVSDTQAGVEWTRSDNGSNVNWSEAQSFCRGSGGSWSLPTLAQLQSLQHKDLPGIPCGQATCNVPNEFKLSAQGFWSSEANGAAEAWGANLVFGSGPGPAPVAGRYARALCVRRL